MGAGPGGSGGGGTDDRARAEGPPRRALLIRTEAAATSPARHCCQASCPGSSRPPWLELEAAMAFAPPQGPSCTAGARSRGGEPRAGGGARGGAGTGGAAEGGRRSWVEGRAPPPPGPPARAAASSLRSHAPPSYAPRPPVRPAAGQGGSRRRGEASSREGAARTELEVAGPGEGGGVRGL